MKICSTINIIVLVFFYNTIVFGQHCQNASVLLGATVQANPPTITLSWMPDGSATQYLLYRIIKGETTWGLPIDTLDGTANQFIDTNVAENISYEYKVQKRFTTNNVTANGYGYINSGIQIAVTENRGKLLLIVDSLFSQPLNFEINQLIADLQGDGWTVQRNDVSRNDSVTTIKQWITENYSADVKAVLLLGHIPVPYSGNLNPDGHGDHLGAWPADTYYADIDGNWTDISVNNTTATSTRNHNIPADGKFDQTFFPSDLELQVGRVDFYNLPNVSDDEFALMQSYLNRNHAYRQRNVNPEKRGIIDDNFGYFSGEAFAATGWRNISVLVGYNNTTAGDYFTSQIQGSYLWSYGCGGGSYQGASDVGNTTNFGNDSLQSTFTLLFGSYHGDWDSQNNFMRASLTDALTCVWAGRPHWYFHHMGLGENIGYATRFSQNNLQSAYQSGFGNRMVHTALLGDPTLRNDMIAPPTNLTLSTSASLIELNWTASADTVLGYHIYKINDATGVFERINDTLVTNTNYTYYCPAFGKNILMVRAYRLETSNSGTYYNLSQGISDSVYVNEIIIENPISYQLLNNVTFVGQVNTQFLLEPLSYSWEFGDGITANTAAVNHTYTEAGNYIITVTVNSLCFSDTLTINISVTSTENVVAEQIAVYPNPSTAVFTITTPIPVFLELYNADLHRITTWDVAVSQMQFTLANKPKGIYFVKIFDKQKSFIGIKKLIVQ